MELQPPIKFTVAHPPCPQPRPRCACRQFPKAGPRCIACGQPSGGWKVVPQIREADGKHGIHLWKRQVLDAWLLAMPSPGFRFTGPVCVSLCFIMPRPKSNLFKTKPMPTVLDTRQNGDVDNLAKGVLDALNDRAFDDDSQIAILEVRKWIAAAEYNGARFIVEQPHCDIEIRQTAAVRKVDLQSLDNQNVLPF